MPPSPSKKGYLSKPIVRILKREMCIPDIRVLWPCRESQLEFVTGGLLWYFRRSQVEGLLKPLKLHMPVHGMPYYIVLYCIILCYTIPYHTIPYHTIPYHTILYYTILYYTILYYTILYYTIPYHTRPYYTLVWFRCDSKILAVLHGFSVPRHDSNTEALDC